MGVLSINYIEGSKKTDLGYKSVEIYYGANKKKIFKTGEFAKDWYDLMKFIIMKLSDSDEYFCHSSSVGHFISDGAPYDSVWLLTNKKPKLVYDRPVSKDYEDVGIEFFVEEGTKPTWEEYKEKYDEEYRRNLVHKRTARKNSKIKSRTKL